MSYKEFPTTKRQKQLIEAAYELAAVRNLRFTFEAFCKVWSQKPNRHTREVLNQLVKHGALKRTREKYKGTNITVFVYESTDPVGMYFICKKLLGRSSLWMIKPKNGTAVRECR